MMEILNKKANFDYLIEDTFETGIVLTGTEIKSIRAGKAQLRDSYALVKRGELFLLNMFISPYNEGSVFNHEETRTRKLLMHKKEISKLDTKIKESGYTLVPLKIYFKNNKAKILLGLGKGKKNYDKREAIKKKDLDRELRKVVKR
jgi:SsrA-binding protein